MTINKSEVAIKSVRSIAIGGAAALLGDFNGFSASATALYGLVVGTTAALIPLTSVEESAAAKLDSFMEDNKDLDIGALTKEQFEALRDKFVNS